MNRWFTKCLAGGVAIAIVVSVSVAMAVPVYLDLGASSTVPVTPGVAGDTWNQLSDLTVGGVGSSIANLIDANDGLTGYGVSVNDAFRFVNDSGGDWAGSPVPWAVAGATSDSFIVERPDGLNRNNVGEITFTGLDDTALYNFTVIASRDAAGGRTGTTTVGGVASDNGNSFEFDAFDDGFNPTPKGLQIWTNISPSGGSVVIRVESVFNGASSFGFLNAVSLELIPEPGSIALMGIGMVSMLLRGRQRS